MNHIINNLQELPNEIIYIVLKYLKSKFILSNIQLVSKQFYLLCQDECLWRNECLEYFKGSPKLKLIKSDREDDDEEDGDCSDTEVNELQGTFNSWKRFFIENCKERYLIIGSEMEEERIVEVKNKLLKRGLENVEHFNLFGFKQLPNLNRFDSILFFSYCGFRQTAIGNKLAEFVDDGGGVVVGSYSNCGKGNRLEGKWLENDYSPFQDGLTQKLYHLKMGSLKIHDHPIFTNIKYEQFSSGCSSHSDSILSKGSISIAEWSNGKQMIAELTNKNAKIIGLNFYPPEASDSNSIDILLFNSIRYVSNFKDQIEIESL